MTPEPEFRQLPPPPNGRKARFDQLYSELALHKAALRVYTKPLFAWRKALTRSHDGQTLYDFARHTPQNLDRLHRQLRSHEFRFRDGLALHRNFNGRERTLHIYPWEERMVDMLLYQMLGRYFHSAFRPCSFAYRHRGFGVDPCQHQLRSVLQSTAGPLYFIKRDVRQFFPSIPHEKLLSLLTDWIEEDDYLYRLLVERVRFAYLRDGQAQIAERGVPFGTAAACFLANVYLTPLDLSLETLKDAHTFRYADDILVVSASREAACKASALLDKGFEQLGLESKDSHHRNFGFRTGADPDFPERPSFRHLGLEFRANGSVGLSRDKARKIRNLFRYAFRRHRRRFRQRQSPETRAHLAVDISRDLIENGVRSVAIIDYYLKHVDDEHQLKLLDRWLAEEILAIAFQSGHRKGHFRSIPFKTLREMGLPSLRHRHRLLRNGNLHSSFFTWRQEKLFEQEKPQSPSRTSGFSPELEAAVLTDS